MTGAVRLPAGIDAPPGCGNADCSVTSSVPAPNDASATTSIFHDRGTHIGVVIGKVSTFASFNPAAVNSPAVHSSVRMNDGVVARRPHTVSPAARLSSEKPTIRL
jgi:hypothetical protein